MALLLGYNQVFFHPELLDFISIYFPHILSISGKPHLLSWEKDLIVQPLYVHLNDKKQGGGKLMFIPFQKLLLLLLKSYLFLCLCALESLTLDKSK